MKAVAVAVGISVGTVLGVLWALNNLQVLAGMRSFVYGTKPAQAGVTA